MRRRICRLLYPIPFPKDAMTSTYEARDASAQQDRGSRRADALMDEDLAGFDEGLGGAGRSNDYDGDQFWSMGDGLADTIILNRATLPAN